GRVPARGAAGSGGDPHPKPPLGPGRSPGGARRAQVPPAHRLVIPPCAGREGEQADEASARHDLPPRGGRESHHPRQASLDGLTPMGTESTELQWHVHSTKRSSTGYSAVASTR